MRRSLRDEADWDRVVLHSVEVGSRNKTAKLVFEGYHYATKGELQLAQLLTGMGIPFVPDVPFTLERDDGRTRLFVPDFIFERTAYVWYGRRRPTLIHGIEAKGKTRNGDFSDRAKENVRLLREQFGLNVLLLSNSQIKHYFTKGRLPLKPNPPST
jgi:hypothetical protein